MRNILNYYKRMGVNLNEKTDYIVEELNIREYTHVLDFGCANGILTKKLAALFPKIKFLGYDFEEVIKNNISELSNLEFINELPEIELPHQRYMIIFSSVIHELSYAEFYKLIVINFKRAKAIAIRDMYTNLSSLDKVRFQLKIIKKLYPENLDYERKENYFFIDWKLIDEMIGKYFISFYDYVYTNEFVKEIFGKKDYILTHRKMIYIKPINKGENQWENQK